MSTRSGFTLVELVIVILVGGILTSIAMNAFGGVTSSFAARSATNTFQAVHARARAYAIERGTTAEFKVSLAGDSVWVLDPSDSTIVSKLHFEEQFNVDIQSSASDPITLCMSPRGYADTGCNSFSSIVNIMFAQAGATDTLTLWPMGQLK